MKILNKIGFRRLDREVQTQVDELNVQVGMYVSAVLMLLEIIMMIAVMTVGKGSLPAGLSRADWVGTHMYAYIFMFAISFGVHIFGILYQRLGLLHSHNAVSAMVIIYTISGAFFGGYLSFVDYLSGEQMLAFVTVQCVFGCLFVLRPWYSCLYIAASGLVYFFVTMQYAKISFVTRVNYLILIAAIVVISFGIYQERMSVIMDTVRMRRISTHDNLTGLKNRTAMHMERSHYAGRDIHVLMCDLDDFKFFNDHYGHDRGDLILKEFAGQLRAVFGGASCYRYGGDEFLVVSENNTLEHFKEQMEDLRQRLFMLMVDGIHISITASGGYVYGYCEQADTIYDMLRVTDRKQYEAKMGGKKDFLGTEYSAFVLQELDAQPVFESRWTSDVDSLTGLPNMMSFRNIASKVLEQYQSNESIQPAFIYFDLENFKTFNERYGFAAGDQLLKGIAGLLTSNFPAAVVSRLADDHFVVLTEYDDLEERIRKTHEGVHEMQKDMVIEIKAGVYLPQTKTEDIMSGSDYAKIACDTIKKKFDQDIAYYTDKMGSKLRMQQYIIDHLDEAIENGYIKVYYQPVVRSLSDKVCGLEALARWQDPKYGMLSPGDFIPVLENFHLIHKLDIQVIRVIASDLEEKLKGTEPVVPVSLNLSRLDFELCDIVGELEAIRLEHNLPCNLLDVEITESAITENPDLIVNQMDRLHKLGYKLWMDDFGSGYSSLNVLKDYGFDLLKIDMMFLRNFENPNTRIIVANIISMAKDLGIQTLTEGVETEEQYRFLQEVGCDRAQGYYFSKPRPLEEGIISDHQDDVEIEGSQLTKYYDDMGNVNMLSPNPIHTVAGIEADEYTRSATPIAIVEFHNEKLSYIHMNNSYARFLETLGYENLEAALAAFDHCPDELSRELHAFAHRAIMTREEVSLDFTSINGKKCNVRGCHIAHDDRNGADAFIVVLTNITKMLSEYSEAV